MKNHLIIIFIVLFCTSMHAQKPILVFDLQNGTQEELEIPNFNINITADSTQYFIGNYNNQIQQLEQSFPTTNTYPESEYTFKRKASDDYDITKFPLRTGVRLFEADDDGIQKNNCSGIFISKRHVLTAAHCVADSGNVLNVTTMDACPIFNDGNVSTFGCSVVNKIYIFKDYNLATEDFAILELDTPLGESTGWVSIGFNDNDNELADEVYYRFSYPNQNFFTEPGIDYDGSIMYYSYGKIDISGENNVEIPNSSGIPGESGSSHLQIKNNESYTVIGGVTSAINLRGSRINNYKFYAFLDVIKDDFVLSTPESEFDSFQIFPNPSNGIFELKGLNNIGRFKASIWDNLGRLVLENLDINNNRTIDLSFVQPGIYYISIKSETKTIIKKIVKI